MKLYANESLHCTDYKMECDRNFFGCFTPSGSHQSSTYDVTANYEVTAKMTSQVKLWELLPGVKQPKKFLSHTISQQCKLSFALIFMRNLEKVR